VTSTHLAYLLLALGLVLGVPWILGAIASLVTRGQARGTYLESHCRWQLRTVGFAMFWFVIGLALAATGIGALLGLPLFFGVYVWVVYRAVRGWRALRRHEPMLPARSP
jgi:uncharacterized membrane protein